MAPKTVEEPKVRRVVKRKIQAVAAPQPQATRTKKSVSPPKEAKVAKPRKPKAVKAETVVAKKQTYPSGQNGPAIDLSVRELNVKEYRVMEVLNGTGRGDRSQKAISELAFTAFAREPAARGMSWVRNSLRRLVRSGYVEKCARGCYRVTDTGRRRLSKAG